MNLAKSSPNAIIDTLLVAAALLWCATLFFTPQITSAAPATQPTTTTAPADTTQLPITITAGHDTDPKDRGRPVILIANALKVTPEKFRDAFSHVHPAPAGQEPDPDQVRKNKAALMSALEPLGVTNERLDEVSNFYRYNNAKGELWKNTPATAVATLKNGQITSITITNPGAGYSSPPQLAIPSLPNLKLTATLSFSTDFKTNGSIKEIKETKDVAPASAPATTSSSEKRPR